MKFIWLKLSDDTTIHITSIKIDDNTSHVNMNFSFLNSICSLFFNSKNATIKLMGSHLPNTCTAKPNTPNKTRKIVRRMIIHVASMWVILCGERCLIPHRNCKYSYYLILSSTIWEYIAVLSLAYFICSSTFSICIIILITDGSAFNTISQFPTFFPNFVIYT